jgi:hypothetical protein
VVSTQNPAAGLRTRPDGAETTPADNGPDYEEDVMVQTKERLSTDVAASRMSGAPSTTRTRIPRRPLTSPVSGHVSQIAAEVAPRASRRSQSGHFVLHYLEMCVPMCVGFAVGDLVYFWAAGPFGYSEPFRELPELSVLIVTFTMTAPMTAWMLFRGMPRRATAEMSASMPVLAIALLALGWLALVSKDDLVLLEHGLMMPTMLVPMFFRLDLYTGRSGAHHAEREG